MHLDIQLAPRSRHFAVFGGARLIAIHLRQSHSQIRPLPPPPLTASMQKSSCSSSLSITLRKQHSTQATKATPTSGRPNVVVRRASCVVAVVTQTLIISVAYCSVVAVVSAFRPGAAGGLCGLWRLGWLVRERDGGMFDALIAAGRARTWANIGRVPECEGGGVGGWDWAQSEQQPCREHRRAWWWFNIWRRYVHYAGVVRYTCQASCSIYYSIYYSIVHLAWRRVVFALARMALLDLRM